MVRFVQPVSSNLLSFLFRKHMFFSVTSSKIHRSKFNTAIPIFYIVPLCASEVGISEMPGSDTLQTCSVITNKIP